MDHYDLIVIGGGAAGFFAAIQASEKKRNLKIAILEKSGKGLSKVRVSGGGRCNVTHGCFDPKLLVKYYPRGEKELLGPFTRFQPRDTMNWFQKEGVELKIEADGRVFPLSDSSETIINSLLGAAKRQGVEFHLHEKVEAIQKKGEWFEIQTARGVFYSCSLLLATGSSPEGHRFAKELGHTITPLVPSLFTFNIPTSPLLDLSGISIPETKLNIEAGQKKWEERGALLLTHFGFSGPVVLRLSAWRAKELHEMGYRATLKVDWTGGTPAAEIKERFLKMKRNFSKQTVCFEGIFPLPRKLGKRLIDLLSLQGKRFADLSKEEIDRLTEILLSSSFQIEGKTTYKNEFVTCGGVKLSEVDFKTLESRLCKGLYFAGEILDIDGITGGFNFQNAWTGGYLVGEAVARAV